MPDSPKWVQFRRRLIPAAMPVVNYYEDLTNDAYEGIDLGAAIHYWNDGWVIAGWSAEALPRVSKYFFDIMMDPSFDLEAQRKKGDDVVSEILKLTKKTAADIENLSNEEVSEFLQKFVSLFSTQSRENIFWWFFGTQPLKPFVEDALKDFDEEIQEEIIDTLSRPVEAGYSEVEEMRFFELYKIAKEKGIDDETVKTEIQRFSEDYIWFKWEYVGPEIWDVPAVTKRIEKALKDGYDHHESDYLLPEEIKAFGEKHGLSNDLMRAFEIWRVTSMMQDDRKKGIAKICMVLHRNIFSQLAERLETSMENVRYVDETLFKEFVETGDRDALIKKLEKRVEKFLMFYRVGAEPEEYTGVALDKKLIEEGFVEEIDETVTEIKGQVASKGKVTGSVRVLASSSGVEDFEEGDILVTPMTTPDFVPLMKKAGAIVTDEGGITCHAAIVSRELGKPCIIATKNATQILKDGMEVEVDAENGVVKIKK